MAIYRRDGYGPIEYTIPQYDKLISHLREEWYRTLGRVRQARRRGWHETFVLEYKTLGLYRRMLTNAINDRKWVMENPYGVGHDPSGNEY